MRTVTHATGSIALTMKYTIGSMIDLQPLYADMPLVKCTDIDGNEYNRRMNLIDVLKSNDEKGIDCTYKSAAILSRHGELWRRYYGYDPMPMYEPLDLIRAIYQPEDFFRLKYDVISTISEGSRRDVESESDIFLAELEARKNAEKPEIINIAQYYMIGNLAGLTAKETYLECPGVLLDIAETKSNSLKKERGVID